MRIVVLMEDLPAEGCPLVNEHGLSFYVETAHHKLLVDTGQSAKTWDNADALGIDLTAVDTVILSHGHYDHTGGAMAFSERNKTAAIYLNENAGGSYWNIRDGKTLQDGARYIGIDRAILQLPQTRLLRGDDVTMIREDGSVQECFGELWQSLSDESIAVFGGVTGRRLWPEGNRILAKQTETGFVQDVFDHEQYVVIRDAGQTVLIGGCAHNGLLNILDRYHELFGDYPDAVVSGFHMMKQGEYTEEEKATIRTTAEELAKLPIRYATGHCTSRPAYDLMKPVLGERLLYFSVGDELKI